MLDPQLIYIALFNRPADPAGLAWIWQATKNGTDLSSLASINGAPEFKARFTGQEFDDLDNYWSDVVNSLYLSMFNRNAEKNGKAYFAKQLISGEQSLSTIAVHIAGAAQGEDKITLGAKLEVAIYFTSILDKPIEVAAYSGSKAAEFGHGVLAGVSAYNQPSHAAIDSLWDGWLVQF